MLWFATDCHISPLSFSFNYSCLCSAAMITQLYFHHIPDQPMHTWINELILPTILSVFYDLYIEAVTICMSNLNLPEAQIFLYDTMQKAVNILVDQGQGNRMTFHYFILLHIVSLNFHHHFRNSEKRSTRPHRKMSCSTCKGATSTFGITNTIRKCLHRCCL